LTLDRKFGGKEKISSLLIPSGHCTTTTGLFQDNRKGRVASSKEILLYSKGGCDKSSQTMFTSYRRIRAWELGDQLALEVYKTTRSFPKRETYGLTSQLRRAALSVPTNIAEGYSRGNNKYFKNFLDTAYGSLVETEYLISFSKKINLVSDDEYARLINLIDETGKVLWKFRESVKSKVGRSKGR
jgi:four helix bundle protein